MVFGLALVLALLFGVASMAFAANGKPFLLGGQVPGKAALQVVNTSTEAGSKGLQLNVATNKPPIQVNAAAGTATNLDADKPDGCGPSLTLMALLRVPRKA